MKKQILLISLLLSAHAFTATAGTDMSKMPMDKGKQEMSATHQGKGKVVQVNAAGSSVKLSHEAIQSLGWSAMTMNFGVADAGLLQGIKAGDAVTFELGQGGRPGSWVITRIAPLGK